MGYIIYIVLIKQPMCIYILRKNPALQDSPHVVGIQQKTFRLHPPLEIISHIFFYCHS